MSPNLTTEILWPLAYKKLSGSPENTSAYFWKHSPDSVVHAKGFVKTLQLQLELYSEIVFLFGLALSLTACASKATWVLNKGQRRLFARDHVEHKATKKPNGTTFTRPSVGNFLLHSRQPADKAWAQNAGEWKRIMVRDTAHNLKSARFDKINNTHVRKDTEAPDWEVGKQMPIVYQWCNRNWAVDGTIPSYPHGVEVDVSQCDTFTPKQCVLYVGPPSEAKAADKAAAPGKDKPEKDKSIKGKQGNRAPPRIIGLVQRSSILGSLQY